MACKLHSGSSGAEWQSFSLSSLSLKNQTNGQVAVISDGASDGSQTLAYYYNNSWYRASDNFQLATSFDSLAWYDASDYTRNIFFVSNGTTKVQTVMI